MEHGAKSQLTRRAERTPRERHTYRTQTALGAFVLYCRAADDDSIAGPREPQKQRASNVDASSASLVGPRGGADAGARLALESGKRTSGNMGRGFRREGAQDVPGERDAERPSTYSRSTARVPVPSTLQSLREMRQARYWRHGRGEPLALALPDELLPVHVLEVCSVPVQVIRPSTSVMRCSQPRQEVTSQPDGPCGWSQPSGSQWTAADSMDPRRFFAGQVLPYHCYAICGLLLCVWPARAVRSTFSSNFAQAMLPVRFVQR